MIGFNKPVKTVDQILTVFTDTVKELEKVSEANAQAVEDSEQIIYEETNRIKVAKQEMNKAASVIQKLNNLIAQ